LLKIFYRDFCASTCFGVALYVCFNQKYKQREQKHVIILDEWKRKKWQKKSRILKKETENNKSKI